MKLYKDGTYKEISELDPSVDEDSKESILLSGIISGISEVEHFLVHVVMKCRNCKNEYQYELENGEDWRKFNYPVKCPKCNEELYEYQNIKGRLRKIVIQEEKKTNPQMIPVYVFNESVNRLEPGKIIRISGTLRSVKKKGTMTYQRVFDANKSRMEDAKPILPRDDEMDTIKSITLDQLVNSFAPNIKGMNRIKESLIIAAVGGIETETERGDINILLLGDPSVGKTQLLKFLVKIVQKSDYASGKSSSQAGLLAGVDNLSDGTRIARAGPVILCSGGLVTIDEMDKMNASDRSGLHEAMESRTYSLKKIGINQTWDAKTVIVGAANPKGSRWDMSISIKENVKMPDSLLSRFGLIWLVRDVPNRESDFEIATHILKSRTGDIAPIIDTTMFMKFINHIKGIHIKHTNDSIETIQEYWLKMREQSQPDESIQIDFRTLQDISRIAEAYARIRMSEDVSKQDALDAISLMNESIKSLGMNTPGEKNQSLVDTMNRDEYIRWVFSEPTSHEMAVVKLMRKPKWFITKEVAEKEIDKLKNKANVLIEREGKLYWV